MTNSLFFREFNYRQMRPKVERSQQPLIAFTRFWISTPYFLKFNFFHPERLCGFTVMMRMRQKTSEKIGGLARECDSAVPARSHQYLRVHRNKTTHLNNFSTYRAAERIDGKIPDFPTVRREKWRESPAVWHRCDLGIMPTCGRHPAPAWHGTGNLITLFRVENN